MSGVVTDKNGSAVYPVNVYIRDGNSGTLSNSLGFYELTIPSETDVILVFSFVGYISQEKKVSLKKGQSIEINVLLETDIKEIKEVSISTRQEKAGSIKINIKSLEFVPGITGSLESLIKTLPGVASNNELSSQYNVRGGNFDENLIYVNNIEIYRPFIVRSGQQEGLSFINSDLVSSLRFSAGGFEAKYGDRMSSVLDVSYKKPERRGGSVSGSLLGGSMHFEGISNNKRFTYLMGLRFKSTSYLLNSLDTQGDYKPNFFDIQGLATYTITKKLEISLLGNMAINNYIFVPQTRNTVFGTVSSPLNLRIFFEGNEANRFNIYQGAHTIKYSPSGNLSFTFINSLLYTSERETYDIYGAYLINELDNTIGSETYGDSILNIGIGSFLNHARNYLDAWIYSATYFSEYKKGRNRFRWGVKYQYNKFHDIMNEWELIDSTGYSLPQQPDKLELYKLLNANNKITSSVTSAFFQDTWGVRAGEKEYFLTAGVRGTFVSLTNNFLISPRATFSYTPGWKRDIRFRISAGMYYQPPVYKELKTMNGQLNKDTKSQRSIHLVLGGDYIFRSGERPFKLMAEMYYKDLNDLIPYRIDNVRIRYAGKNIAKGYATGFDLKLNGEFVEGTESWISLSIMQTREDIKDDFYYHEKEETFVRTEPGYYPRPTDQLFRCGLFFQDYFPNNPNYKVNLTFYYGSRLPYSSPGDDRYDLVFRMPPYRRVDIGISKNLNRTGKDSEKLKSCSIFQNIWLNAEVFNLFGMNNTISYLWVRTISNQENIPGMYAIPNYLTSRRFNISIRAVF